MNHLGAYFNQSDFVVCKNSHLKGCRFSTTSHTIFHTVPQDGNTLQADDSSVTTEHLNQLKLKR
jgi:hypothetical protein